MCGIVGYVKMEPRNRKEIHFENLDFAFGETMSRGRQATGFYTPITGVVKDGISADEFFKKHPDEIKAALKSPVFIGHCRAATTGFRSGDSTSSNNNNNHPHEGERFVLVHNGHYNSLFELKDYNYKGNCDSELALAYIETFGPIRGIQLMPKTDNFSLVFYDKKEKRVYFYRESNPLVYAINRETGHLLFGSTSHIIMELVDTKKLFGLRFATSLTPCYATDEHELYSFKPGEDIEKTKIDLPSCRYDAEKLFTDEEKKLVKIPEYKSSVIVTPSENKHSIYNITARTEPTRYGGKITSFKNEPPLHRLEYFVNLIDGIVTFNSAIHTTHYLGREVN